MSYPEKYTRQYSFQAYQNANPARPLPGNRLDAELNSVSATTGALATEVQRLSQIAAGSSDGSNVTSEINALTLGAAATESLTPDSVYAKNEAALNAAIVGGVSPIYIPSNVRYRRANLVANKSVLIIDDSRGARITNQDWWWQPGMGRGMMISHHGLQGIMPENTMPAFSAARDLPAQEVDIHISSDGEVVCIHDDTVDRTTDGTGNVADMTYAELAALNAAAKAPWAGSVYDGTTRIPKLSDVLQLTAQYGQRCFVDFKNYRTQSDIDLVLALIAQYAPDSVLGFPGIGVDNRMSDYRYVRAKNKSIALWAGLAGLDDADDIREFAQLGGELYIDIEYSRAMDEPELVAAARDEGVQVISDGIDRQWQITNLQSIGIDHYFSDTLLSQDDNFAVPVAGSGGGSGPDPEIVVPSMVEPASVWDTFIHWQGANKQPDADLTSGVVTLSASNGDACRMARKIKAVGGEWFEFRVEARASAGNGRVRIQLDVPFGPTALATHAVIASAEWQEYIIKFQVPPTRQTADVYFQVSTNGTADTVHFRRPRINRFDDCSLGNQRNAYGLTHPAVVNWLQSLKQLDGAVPKAYQTAALHEFVRTGELQGWWSKLDLCILGNGLDLNSSLVDIVSGKRVLYAVGVTQTALTELKGNGTTGAVWAVGDFSKLSHYTQDAGHIGVVVTSDAGVADGFILGAGNIRLTPRTSGGVLSCRMNATVTDTVPNSSPLGHIVLNRTSSSSFDIWQAGSKLATKARTSAAPSGPLYLFYLSNNYRDYGLSLFHMGGTLSDSDVTNLKAAFDILSTKWSNDTSRINVHGADIASAATLNLNAATGDCVDVTGTTGITAITLAEGLERTVRFTGALTLTNSASLVLPRGKDKTTTAGDIAKFRGYAGGVVRCTGYTPADSALAVADGGTGAVDSRTAMKNLKGVYVLAASAVAVPLTGTTSETALATITVPANAMGPNGRIEIEWIASYTNSANNKTINVRFGGISGTQFQSNTRTTTAGERGNVCIANRNATNSQVGWVSNNVVGFGTTAASTVTAAKDTTSAQDIVISGTLANSGETITLESYIVRLVVP